MPSGSLSRSLVVGQWYLPFGIHILSGELRTEEGTCGGQLHSQIFLLSWYISLWSWLQCFSLSGLIMPESSVGGIAGKLWIWTHAQWDAHFLLYNHWWWKTGKVHKDKIQAFIRLEMLWMKALGFLVICPWCVLDCTVYECTRSQVLVCVLLQLRTVNSVK